MCKAEHCRAFFEVVWFCIAEPRSARVSNGVRQYISATAGKLSGSVGKAGEFLGRECSCLLFFHKLCRIKNRTTMSSNNFRENVNTQLGQAKVKARRIFKVTMWGLLIAGILSGIGYYVYRTFPKSESEQTGTLFKLAYDGYVFKTYEGQLHLIGSSMITTQSTWNFSVKNKEVYENMQKLVGKSVKVYYEELPETALPWQGKTAFIVYKVEALQ